MARAWFCGMNGHGSVYCLSQEDAGLVVHVRPFSDAHVAALCRSFAEHAFSAPSLFFKINANRLAFRSLPDKLVIPCPDDMDQAAYRGAVHSFQLYGVHAPTQDDAVDAFVRVAAGLALD